MFKDRKGQTGGLITGIIFGVASLVIGVIIAFVIVSTLNNAGLLPGATVITQSTNLDMGWINSTSYVLGGGDVNSTRSSFIIVGVVNGTIGINSTIEVGNFTLDITTGSVLNATAVTYPNATFNFTFDFTSQEVPSEKKAVDNLVTNFTAGVDQVSSKIPTVLLVAAIVLILGVLAILVLVWQKMRLSGSGSI